MKVLLVSADPYAVQWTKDMNQHGIEVTHVQSFREALRLMGSGTWFCVIVEAKLGDEGDMVYSLPNFLSAAPDPDIYVRFTPQNFETRVYDALLNFGVTGMFIGWPTQKILEHEIMNRGGNAVLPHPRWGKIKIEGKNLWANGKSVRLTEKEKKILMIIFQAKGRPVSVTMIKVATGQHPDTKTHTVEAHIYRIRQKLGGINITDLILHEDGGYKISPT